MFKKNILLALVLSLFALFPATPAMAAGAHKLEKEGRKALEELYKKNPKARIVGSQAVGVLVFPGIWKGGLMFGAQRGDGVLFTGDTVAGYYNSTAVSWGLQAGLQKFGYALFFMNTKALNYLNQSDGFELGGAPNLTVVDMGVAAGLSTTTLQKDIYAFFFNQQGLMAGISLQGTKVTPYTPSE
ncbi:MAG: lipid-binding SYLF domain-containing protein [Verrucomicrobiae bacterium]|nr:lipid-binding SYLF domain-containing protein [Verrucomicrobiae bacterium]